MNGGLFWVESFDIFYIYTQKREAVVVTIVHIFLCKSLLWWTSCMAVTRAGSRHSVSADRKWRLTGPHRYISGVECDRLLRCWWTEPMETH